MQGAGKPKNRKMKLSLAITTYNRYEMTVESFAQVIDDPRIDDIVILDDCSTDNSYQKLVEHFKGNEKVRVIRQAQNRGMGLNKKDAIALAKNDWVGILDSDNIMGSNYIEALDSIGGYPGITQLYKDTIYVPDFAKPQFDYQKFAGKRFNRKNVIDLVNDKTGNCLLNTCNYLVNRKTYLKVYEHNPEMKGTDTVWFNYLWLKAGNSFYVVPGMEYYHRVHNGSGFLQDANYNMKKSEEIRRLIMAL
jgi:glycosyltransferase involved in cell wall biosynthesis